jgi:hypothetical protein
VIAVLALTTIGGAVLGWNQYQELVELRAAALDKSERADWQKRVWDLEKSNRELSDQLAALRAENGDVDGAIAAAGERPVPRDRGGRGGPEGRGPRGGAFTNQAAIARDLLAKPEIQAFLNQQRKSAVEERYSALIKKLNLPPDQAERLKTLLGERQNTAQDVLTAALEQGVDPRTDREGLRKLMQSARDDVDNSIKSLLGESGFDSLKNYEQTMPQRNLVDQINRRLAVNGEPMNPVQMEQLVDILAANAPPRPTPTANGDGGPGGRGFGPGFGGRGDIAGGGVAGAALGAVLDGGVRGPIVTAAAVNQAQGILSQSQLAALQQVQQQQQQAFQVRQIVNETLSANQPAKGTTPKGGTNPGAGGRRRGGGG